MADAPSSTPATPSAAPLANTSTTTPPADSVGSTATEAASEVSPVQEAQPPTQQEIKEAIKKWNLKSNGKNREVASEAELVRLAQLGLGAHEKFEQAATSRKKAEAILELLQKDPQKALQSLGHDVRKMAEDYLMNEAKKQMMSPEERQKSEIMAEIDRLRAEKDDLVKQQREERIQKLQTKYESDIQDQIIKAIDTYKLPKNPKTVARIAEYMASALENGYEATAADVATRVRGDLEDEHKSLFSHYDVDDLVKLLGDEQLKKIRQYEVQKVKAKAPVAPTKTEAVASKPQSDDDKPKKGLSMDDFQKELDKYLK